MAAQLHSCRVKAVGEDVWLGSDKTSPTEAEGGLCLPAGQNFSEPSSRLVVLSDDFLKMLMLLNIVISFLWRVV